MKTTKVAKMLKTAHHWGVCNTFELELDIPIPDKLLKPMLDILKKNKLWGEDAEYFSPNVLNAKELADWMKKLAELKKKLMDKAKRDGKKSIFETMAAEGFVPKAIIKAPSMLGPEASKQLSDFIEGREQADEIMQDSTIIAWVNPTTGKLKFAGQSGVDIKSGNEQSKEVDKKILKPMLKKGIVAATTQIIAESKGKSGLDFKITTDPATGKMSAEADITDSKFTDSILPVYNQENDIEVQESYE